MYTYFVDSVIKQVEEDLQQYLNCTELEAYNTLYYGVVCAERGIPWNSPGFSEIRT